MLKRMLIVVAFIVAVAGSAFVAAGAANPLADDLAAETERADVLAADVAAETDRADGFRADLAEAYESIDRRAERDRGMAATINEQAEKITDAETEAERLRNLATQHAERAEKQAERASGLQAELDAAGADIASLEADAASLESDIASLEAAAASLESDVAQLEDRLAEKMRRLEASDRACGHTYCTEEQAFGLDLIYGASTLWVDAAEGDAVIASLSAEFGIPTPKTRYGVALGPNVGGQYLQGVIEFADIGGTDAWTLMHEFAHHLECHTDACVGHHSDGFIEAMRDILDALNI